MACYAKCLVFMLLMLNHENMKYVCGPNLDSQQHTVLCPVNVLASPMINKACGLDQWAVLFSCLTLNDVEMTSCSPSSGCHGNDGPLRIKEICGEKYMWANWNCSTPKYVYPLRCTLKAFYSEGFYPYKGVFMLLYLRHLECVDNKRCSQVSVSL